MAGGYKTFGPTYNATKYVRVLHEGMINGNHSISSDLVAAKTDELAGRIASITNKGVGLSNAGKGAVGLFVEDLGDMVNASEKASFYFRGGEYAVAVERTAVADNLKDEDVVGKQLTTDADGKLTLLTDAVTETAVGVATSYGEFKMGNMYEHAGLAANGGVYLGFILYV